MFWQMARIGILAGVSPLMFAAPGQSETVAEFYQRRNVTMIISSGGGGSYTLIYQTIARFMPRHIPGNPRMVIKAMPGAGHVIATNYMFNQADKDGTYVASIGNTVPLHQILDGKGVRYDAAQFNWLGSTGISNLVTVAWRASGIETIEDAYNREVIAGGTGAGSGTVLYPTVTNNVLGTKFKLVIGYVRAPEIDIGMVRGEIHARSGFSYGSLALEHPDWIEEKKVSFLFQVGHKRDRALPDVPLMTELAKNDEQRQILALVSSPVALGRPFLTTPGVPADRLAALRAAFDATMNDKDFLSEAKRLNFDLFPMTGDEVARIVNEMIRVPPEVIAKAKAAMGASAGASE